MGSWWVCACMYDEPDECNEDRDLPDLCECPCHRDDYEVEE